MRGIVSRHIGADADAHAYAFARIARGAGYVSKAIVARRQVLFEHRTIHLKASRRKDDALGSVDVLLCSVDGNLYSHNSAFFNHKSLRFVPQTNINPFFRCKIREIREGVVVDFNRIRFRDLTIPMKASHPTRTAVGRRPRNSELVGHPIDAFRSLDRLSAEQLRIGALLPEIVQVFNDRIRIVGICRIRPSSLVRHLMTAEINEMP